MEKSNFYFDIKESIEKHFDFLKDFGFPKFEEEQIAYELHFKTKNNHITFDIWVEAIPSTPIWVKVNQYYLDSIELENQKIKDYHNQLKENYDKIFQKYLKTNHSKYLTSLSKQYAVNGLQINDDYLKELSMLLKRHLSVLGGDLEILKLNAEVIKKESDLIIDKERIERGIYTLEFQFFASDEYDCYEEFRDLKLIKPYLVERPEIKIYRVLDCYLNELDFEL
jgi:hypothetical protein